MQCSVQCTLGCHLLGHVPGGAGGHVLGNVVEVLHVVDLEVMRQPHQVHELAGVQEPAQKELKLDFFFTGS